jgi:hypothetical protein
LEAKMQTPRIVFPVEGIQEVAGDSWIVAENFPSPEDRAFPVRKAPERLLGWK